MFKVPYIGAEQCVMIYRMNHQLASCEHYLPPRSFLLFTKTSFKALWVQLCFLNVLVAINEITVTLFIVFYFQQCNEHIVAAYWKYRSYWARTISIPALVSKLSMFARLVFSSLLYSTGLALTEHLASHTFFHSCPLEVPKIKIFATMCHDCFEL